MKFRGVGVNLIREALVRWVRLANFINWGQPKRRGGRSFSKTYHWLFETNSLVVQMAGLVRQEFHFPTLVVSNLWWGGHHLIEQQFLVLVF